MADESRYSAVTDTATNKRKYDDQTPSSGTRRSTGFSSGPIPSASPDSVAAPPPSYNSVPPPADEIQLAKQRAQEIAARLISGADAKRPRVENGASLFDSNDKGFSSSAVSDGKPLSGSLPSSIPLSYGSFQGTSKKIEIPNIRVGVIIGKGGETIKYLQLQSGAKIQVTRDVDADPNSPNRMVELMGTSEQIAKAEQLINEVLQEAEAGGSGIVSRRLTGQAGSEQFVMKIPNNKVGLVIGKGGETIKTMQAKSGARIQVIPLHLPPGDTSTERTLQVDGTSEQIEHAKQLVNEVISEHRLRNPGMAGGYPQQGYQARPPASWAPSGAPQMQQPGYGYMQPGGYPGPSPQYSQPPYAGYPPQASGGYPPNWDQSSSQQATSGGGYDYYNQPPSSQQQQTSGGSAAPADNTGYNYNQPPSGYNQPGQGYTQDGYGGYHTHPQSGYGQQPTYDQQQGYGSAPNYGSVTNPTQEGHTPSYGSQGDSSQAPPPVQPPAMGQQGYSSSQQPSPNTAGYPPQGSAQQGYGMPPTSQTAYGSQAPAQSGYGAGYGASQAQKPLANPPVYGQTQHSPSAGGYAQPAPVQPGYPPSQPPSSGYTQPDSSSQRAPPSGYGTTSGQSGYSAYGAPPANQQGYVQGQPPYNTSYGSGYSQPPVYSDGNATGNARGAYETAPASQTVQQSGVAKTSPKN
ncbi:far upstream element-binding protein 1 [Carica papaya]|uniref:far upstream element-binding protein 1 n=1 Tax=Carica papaya TaxID=3649 RepID=UPI000B8CE304|nr:far upstream element-binding protein 1 [Carica papaya]